jgi:CheY-like chemotaxis protein
MSQRFVFLIDADSNLDRHLTSELRRQGFRVESSLDANDLMSRKDDLPSLIVLCIDPKRTGWAVCNRLRKSSQLKSVPLIITSAEATEKDFEDHKKLKTRAEDYLHKPFPTDALVEKIGGLIGLPDPPQEDEAGLEIPVEAEEIAVEDDGMVVEEEADSFYDEPPPPAPMQPMPSSSFATVEDSQDRTRIGTMMDPDQDVSLETDAAFAAIGADDADEHTSTMTVPPETRAAESLGAVDLTNHEPPPGGKNDYEADSPFESEPLPEVEPQAQPEKSPSVDLDLGLDKVAQQAAAEPPQRLRRNSSPAILTSAVAPVVSTPPPKPPTFPIQDTATHDTVQAALEETRTERDRLKREVEELKSKQSQRNDAPPAAAGGFSREREFLNLREIINKKEKEILDLRDSLDAKERQILDGKDKLRELERRARDLDEKSLSTERDLVAAREKVEALAHDKERVVEREKQVKGRLDDALKTLSRYEEEIEGWKRKHAQDVSALEQSYNAAVAAHQAELAEVNQRHTSSEETLREQHAAHLREAVDTAEAEKQAVEERHQQERGRQEAEHARALQLLRESKDTEREAQRVGYEQKIAETQEQQQVELQALAEQHAQVVAQLKTEHQSAAQEKDQLHADELAGMRARHTQDMRAAQRANQEEIAKLHEHYKNELAAAEDRRVQELQQKEEEQHDELDRVIKQHLQEKQALEAEHEAALQAAEEKRVADLAAAAAAADAEHQRTVAAAEEKREQEAKAARDAHLRKVQALEESHADLKAGMQQRHAQQLDELKAQHAAAIDEYEQALKERDSLISEGHTKIDDLEKTIVEERSNSTTIDRVRAELAGLLDTARKELSDREQRIADRDKRIGELEQESSGYQDQILKAYQRIKSDESIVSRARKALAIALTLLDEQESDGGDEKSS